MIFPHIFASYRKLIITKVVYIDPKVTPVSQIKIAWRKFSSMMRLDDLVAAHTSSETVGQKSKRNF